MGPAFCNDEPLAEWELELLDNHTTTMPQPDRYRVTQVLPFGSREIGTYRDDEYQGGIQRFITDLNAAGAHLKVSVIKTTVTTTTKVSTEETDLIL